MRHVVERPGAGGATPAASAEMRFVLPAAQLLAYLAIVGVAGVLAGLVPARRAARLDVLASIARQ